MKAVKIKLETLSRLADAVVELTRAVAAVNVGDPPESGGPVASPTYVRQPIPGAAMTLNGTAAIPGVATISNPGGWTPLYAQPAAAAGPPPSPPPTKAELLSRMNAAAQQATEAAKQRVQAEMAELRSEAERPGYE